MRVLRLFLLAWFLLPTTRSLDQERKVSDVVIEPATVTASDGGAVDDELGTLYVAENRADPKSRVIGIGFARFKALERTGAPPMFFLPGGPGGSYLSDLKSTSRLPGRLKQIAQHRRVADVVLVDQRGHSERGDTLKFKYRTPDQPLDQPTDIARSSAAFVETARAAVEELSGKGFDLRGYTVKECADDVNDLRKALAYDRISLVGGSFGSQWSFAVMRRHPDIVARALLGGVEPLDYTLLS